MSQECWGWEDFSEMFIHKVNGPLFGMSVPTSHRVQVPIAEEVKWLPWPRVMPKEGHSHVPSAARALANRKVNV